MQEILLFVIAKETRFVHFSKILRIRSKALASLVMVEIICWIVLKLLRFQTRRNPICAICRAVHGGGITKCLSKCIKILRFGWGLFGAFWLSSNQRCQSANAQVKSQRKRTNQAMHKNKPNRNKQNAKKAS